MSKNIEIFSVIFLTDILFFFAISLLAVFSTKSAKRHKQLLRHIYASVLLLGCTPVFEFVSE